MLGEEMHRVRDPELVSRVLGTEPAGTVSVLLLRHDLPGTVHYSTIQYSTVQPTRWCTTRSTWSPTSALPSPSSAMTLPTRFGESGDKLSDLKARTNMNQINLGTRPTPT